MIRDQIRINLMPAKFTSPTNRDSFNATAWEIVRQIPVGKVAAYGQIAAFIPVPDKTSESRYRAWGARWVGGAMAACPPDVPWQRVVNAQGKISLRKGAEQQRRLLEAEGVVFDEKDRINLAEYGWEGPTQAWLVEHGLLPDMEV
jgi:methylated-DNA-protein-cysteine methyltransferase-like protein